MRNTPPYVPSHAAALSDASPRPFVSGPAVAPASNRRASIPHAASRVALGVLLAGVLLGCSAPPPPPTPRATSVSAGTSTPTPTPAAHPDSEGECKLLTTDEVTDLLGEPGGPGTLLDNWSGLCRWTGSDGTYLSVVAVASPTWASLLPAMIEDMKVRGKFGGDPAAAKRLEQASASISKGGSVSPDLACELFLDTHRVQGLPAEKESLVTRAKGDKPTSWALTSCSHGLFSSLTLIKTSGITNPDAEALVRDIGRQVRVRSGG